MKEKFTYFNKEKSRYGYIERKNLHGWKWYAIHDEQVNGHKAFVDALEEMQRAGYAKMGEVDEYGVLRHNLGVNELYELYKRLDNFIGDCTREEAEEYRGAFAQVLSLIHQRIASVPIAKK